MRALHRTVHEQGVILTSIIYFTVLEDCPGIVRGLPNQPVFGTEEMEIILKCSCMEIIFYSVMYSSCMNQLAGIICNQW